MKIKKIIIENNPIFGPRVEFDFTKDDGLIYDNIFFIGENGSGKSTLLDIIFDFSNYRYNYSGTNEIRIFDIELSEAELGEINQIDSESSYSSNFIFRLDFSQQEGRNQIEITHEGTNLHGSIFHSKKEIFKGIYSTAEISFNSDIPTSITNKNTDEIIKDSVKSPTDLANQITQLLVDIRQKDNEDAESYRDIHSKSIPEKRRQIRTKRFKNAFTKIFSDKLQYSGVKDLKPVFKKGSEEFDITKLSSGEKQIVFRGGFLLKDQNSLTGAPVLIDEPEISLHPSRQLRILDYYRAIFTDLTNNTQTSQIFFTTHSPYVLKSYSPTEHKIFIFNRDEVTQKVSITPDNQLGKLYGNPTWGEINRYAYGLPTAEFHDEIYGFLHDRYIQQGIDDADKNNRAYLNSFDIEVIQKLGLSIKIRDEERYLIGGFITKTHQISLSTFIRHKLHHPENRTMNPRDFTTEEFRESIEAMVTLI